jgi:hypothetical protein
VKSGGETSPGASTRKAPLNSIEEDARGGDQQPEGVQIWMQEAMHPFEIAELLSRSQGL